MSQQPATGPKPPETLILPLSASSPVNKAALENTLSIKGARRPCVAVRAPTLSLQEGAPRRGAQPLPGPGPGLPLAKPQCPACTTQLAAGRGETYSLRRGTGVSQWKGQVGQTQIVHHHPCKS